MMQYFQDTCDTTTVPPETETETNQNSTYTYIFSLSMECFENKNKK